MSEINLEPNVTRICTIINEYKILKEEMEKRINPTKEEFKEKKTNELDKAKNKIYDYFEKIQDILPSYFLLDIKLDISLEGSDSRTYINFRDDDIKLEISTCLGSSYYHLSRKNKNYNSALSNEYFIDYVVDLVKNWDKIQYKVESEIQKYFESRVNEEINDLSENISVTELLTEFNS